MLLQKCQVIEQAQLDEYPKNTSRARSGRCPDRQHIVNEQQSDAKLRRKHTPLVDYARLPFLDKGIASAALALSS